MHYPQLRVYELPDWQFIRPEFKITAPAVESGVASASNNRCLFPRMARNTRDGTPLSKRTPPRERSGLLAGLIDDWLPKYTGLA